MRPGKTRRSSNPILCLMLPLFSARIEHLPWHQLLEV
jgi:hypothetical protein